MWGLLMVNQVCIGGVRGAESEDESEDERKKYGE